MRGKGDFNAKYILMKNIFQMAEIMNVSVEIPEFKQWRSGLQALAADFLLLILEKEAQ